MNHDIKTLSAQLISAGKILDNLRMVPATSGNFSARLSDSEIAITISGVHKGRLTENDLLSIGINEEISNEKKPSAETALHLQLYKLYQNINCVLHPHSQGATLTKNYSENNILLEGYELQKAFEGVTSHASKIIVPIFENDQDISRLAKKTEAYLIQNPDTKAYIIRGHGFYTWASSISATVRQCEALEFLLQCEINQPVSK
jgi:methylthioribulose-1-phosphate dehydratase